MSSRHITHIETDLLAKGFNFSITSKTLPNKDIIATVEDAVKYLEKEEADTIRAKVILTLRTPNVLLSITVSGNSFLLLTLPGPFKLDLFGNFGTSKILNTVFI